MNFKKRKPFSGPTSGKVDLVWDTVDPDLDVKTVLAQIYGDTDTGRSSLALTMPDPFCYIHTMEKHTGLLSRVLSQGKTIKSKGIHRDFESRDPDLVQKLASEQVKIFETFYRHAYSFARTIIIDNATDLWALYQLAKLGTLIRSERSDGDRRGQLVYAEINAHWSSIFGLYKRMAAATSAGDRDLATNLVVISKTGPEYKRKMGRSGKPTAIATGRTVRAGQKDVLTEMDVSIRTRREGDEFYAVIEKPWFNEDARGEEFTGDRSELTMRRIMGYITGTLEPWE